MVGTTTQSCRCWHNGQRGQWGGRRKDGARTAHYDPWIIQGSCSASEEPSSVLPAGDWTCMFLNHSCRQKRKPFIITPFFLLKIGLVGGGHTHVVHSCSLDEKKHFLTVRLKCLLLYSQYLLFTVSVLTLCEIAPLWLVSWSSGCHCWQSLVHCSVEVCSKWYGSPLAFHQPSQTHPRLLAALCLVVWFLALILHLWTKKRAEERHTVIREGWSGISTII